MRQRFFHSHLPIPSADQLISSLWVIVFYNRLSDGVAVFPAFTSTGTTLPFFSIRNQGLVTIDDSIK